MDFKTLKKKTLYKLFSRPQKLSNPTSTDVSLSASIQKEADVIRKGTLLTNFWGGIQDELYNCFQNEDIRNFTNWQPIRKTMFFRIDESEYYELKKHPNWSKWKEAITEDSFGNPIPYYLHRKSSPNLIQHLYNYMLFVDKVPGFKLEDITTVFEFGGGYGSFRRLLHKLGFKGSYLIYDLPMFSLLQKAFLTSVLGKEGVVQEFNTEGLHKTSLYFDEPALEKQKESLKNTDLFIAHWSLSETPIELRDKILSLLSDCKYYCIGYQYEFVGMDNREYFEKLRFSKPNYTWHDFELEKIKGNRYLVGIRND